MTTLSSETLHATSVAIDGRAVLLEGVSGTGKSDLALRLIDRGATLISDDQTLLVRQGDVLVARAPATMRGQIEVRGLGIVTLPYVDAVPVALIVRLGVEPMRMPERRQRRLAGIVVREIAFEAFHASTPVKIEWALRQPEATPA
ncbi:MAG: HPr kinase/phosphorylase [Sphingomonas sp.]